MRVGFDIEMATLLARDLGVGLELVRIEPAAVADLLAAGYLDTVMSGMLLTADLLDKMAFSAPYLDETLAFLVRDHHRHVFSNLELLRLMESPRIAVLDVPYYTRMLQSYLPQAEVVVLESPRDFLRDESGELDAMLFSAEAGSAWSLIYPEFSVAVPKPDLVSIPLAYPLARGEEEMARFLSAWIELKRKDGTISQLYERWILGQSARASEARWSVIHDVLGWVD
jgi:ABC-type amino acid transport substrate-binding protein